VPISMHGDGVPCVAVGKSGTKSFDIFSWQGIMASGRTAKVKHMIFGMFQASLAKSKAPNHGGHDTMVECWQVMMWSLMLFLKEDGQTSTISEDRMTRSPVRAN